MLIKNKDLELLLLNVLGKRYPRYLAQKITDVIMFGELSGNKSHGIVRIVDGDCSVVNQKPIKFPYIKKISSISRIIDGNENSAMLVAHLAMEEAIKIAQKKKIAIIGTRNTFSTSGCLSYYLNTIAQNDFISIIFAKSSDRAIHFGGLEKLYGSNPLAIGIPTNKDPILLDMSTTSMSWGEVLNAKRTKTNLPPQSAIDEFGNYTLNPANVFALVPFDRSYKGSGLAMMAEIFAGILTGSSFVNFDKEKGWGIFFLV
ncbi:MAG: Ldh family oxidoreductase, partial [bacterium]|nr:Ldh family oxidoreductase [bacterium]